MVLLKIQHFDLGNFIDDAYFVTPHKLLAQFKRAPGDGHSIPARSAGAGRFAAAFIP